MHFKTACRQQMKYWLTNTDLLYPKNINRASPTQSSHYFPAIRVGSTLNAKKTRGIKLNITFNFDHAFIFFNCQHEDYPSYCLGVLCHPQNNSSFKLCPLLPENLPFTIQAELQRRANSRYLPLLRDVC